VIIQPQSRNDGPPEPQEQVAEEVSRPASPNVVEFDDPSNASEGAMEPPADLESIIDEPEEEPVAHRTRSHNPDVPSDDPTMVPREQREPQWTRDDKGRLVRERMNFAAMSKKEFGQAKASLSKSKKKMYECSLSAKQPPRAAAMSLSRNKLKYRQRIARQREEGDRALAAMFMGDETDVTKPVTVDEIMHSSLGKFIEFASNDCGYDGSFKELICNHIHPLFLKAKAAASKEDNPNWW